MKNCVVIIVCSQGLSLHWVTPALSAAATGDEFTLEGGRVRVSRKVESFSSDLVTVTSTTEVDPVALGDQGFYVCRAARKEEGGEVKEAR